ncbi:cupin-like domain-containing protein [Sphingomonas sp. BT-65]|uniref:cupin-like domain-containing protein n=1 Tax=Sphingomonas sp. BT-65 TaxID=2989821 RepID=UPI003558D4E4
MAEQALSIPPSLTKVPERDWRAVGLDTLLKEAREPFVVRGLVADWPLVAVGKSGARAARRYLLDHARDRPFTVSIGSPGHDGRMFYDTDMQMNFRTGTGKLADIFAGIDKAEELGENRTVYLASIDIPSHFDGLDAANPIDLGMRDPLKSIWIGTRTLIAAHNDFPDNLACVAVGRRRFTLFPPDQFRNLYLGPIDNTPAGRTVSMVDFNDPDFERYPRFREALEHAMVAELGPGDAIHIPMMWWHHIEGLDPFNVLVNYWWRDTPRWLGQPQDALNHAILSIRDLPPEQKAHWRALFDHYVFANGDDVTEHLPEGMRGILDPLTHETASRIRAYLLRQLSR